MILMAYIVINIWFTCKNITTINTRKYIAIFRKFGEGFIFVKNEYKIKLGNNNNYIDILLYNLEYRCYVLLELKVAELKKYRTNYDIYELHGKII